MGKLGCFCVRDSGLYPFETLLGNLSATSCPTRGKKKVDKYSSKLVNFDSSYFRGLGADFGFTDPQSFNLRTLQL